MPRAQKTKQASRTMTTDKVDVAELPESAYSVPASIHQPRKRLMLQAYSRLGVVGHSAAAAGISRSTHGAWLRSDPVYADAFEESRAAFADYLEAIAFYRIQRQGPNASPLLLITLLNGHLPHKYRQTNGAPADSIATTVLERLREFARQGRTLGVAGGGKVLSIGAGGGDGDDNDGSGVVGDSDVGGDGGKDVGGE